jgi:hypothetical protein
MVAQFMSPRTLAICVTVFLTAGVALGYYGNPVMTPFRWIALAAYIVAIGSVWMRVIRQH